jgi:hypoxanthine phosphoribosyltransferase
VVDDVADTGETVELVAKHVMEKNAKEVRTAVIDFKHTSKFVPDYYAREMEKWAWIVYPWSLYEDEKDLIAKLNCNGMSANEIAKKLAEEFELYVDESIVEEILKDC